MSTELVNGLLLYRQPEIDSKYALFLVHIAKKNKWEVSKIFPYEYSTLEIAKLTHSIDIPETFRPGWFNEFVLSDLLSKLLVDTGITRSIVKIHKNEKIPINDFIKIIDAGYYELIQDDRNDINTITEVYKNVKDKLNKLVKIHEFNKCDGMIYMMRMERVSSYPLYSYIQKTNIYDFRSVRELLRKVFEVIYTYRCIKKLYPTFYHGDLHVGNIMLKPVGNYEQYTHYQIKVNDEINDYYVRSNGFTVAIIDFGISYCPELKFVNIINSNSYRGKGLIGENDLYRLVDSIYNIFLVSEKKNEFDSHRMTAVDSQLPGFIDFFEKFSSKSVSSIAEKYVRENTELDIDEVITHKVFDFLKTPQTNIFATYKSTEFHNIKNKKTVEKEIIAKYEELL